MATYQSIQSNTSDNTGSVTITKPTSLAVGDFMIAGIMVEKDAGTSASISTPSGWSQVELLDINSGNGAIGVYTKSADSSDVAASNFTFNGSGSTSSMSMLGAIIRATDWGGVAGTTSGTSFAASNTLTLTGITPAPAQASSLYLVFAGRVFGTPVTVSSVSIATSNPTWTERVELTVNGSSVDTQFAVYTANRTETTATGDYTITYADTNNNRSAAVALIIHNPVGGSVAPDSVTANAYAFTGVQSATVNAVVPTPSLGLINPTIWTTTIKS